MESNEDIAYKLLDEYNLADEVPGEREDGESNNNVNILGIIFMAFIWVEGLREGSKLVWVPQQEHLYYVNGPTKKGTACTCMVDGCGARIFLTDNGMAKCEHTSIHKNHATLYSKYKERCLFKWMKDRCRSAPASATIHNIYDEAVLL